MEDSLSILMSILFILFFPAGPILFILYLFIKRERNRQKICPNCKLRIHKEANICHHCHSKLD